MRIEYSYENTELRCRVQPAKPGKGRNAEWAVPDLGLLSVKLKKRLVSEKRAGSVVLDLSECRSARLSDLRHLKQLKQTVQGFGLPFKVDGFPEIISSIVA